MVDRRVAVFAIVAALVTFCIVQDRVTAAGARRYVAMQRAALAGRGPAVTIDDVMEPAVRSSVRDAARWSGGVAAAGLAVAAVVARSAGRRSRRAGHG